MVCAVCSGSAGFAAGEVGDGGGGAPERVWDATSPAYNKGQQLLRRGYSYCELIEPGSGALEAGLFFIVFQRSPRQFIDIQRRLAASDALNRHTEHTASAIFACPPGAKPGQFIGERLLT